MPSKLELTCGGAPIISVLFASYGVPKGKCSDGGFGSGSSWTFEDVTRPALNPSPDHPTCSCLDVKPKLSTLCVGKPSCSIDVADANGLFGSDPCYQVGKWVAVVVECPSTWGWTFILCLALGVAGYLGGAMAYNHKVKGAPLDRSGLPHQAFWAEFRSLVEDGVAMAKAKATGGGGAGGPYQPVGDAEAEPAAPEATKAQPKQPKQTRPEPEPEPAAAAVAAVSSSSDDDDEDVVE